MLLAVADFSNRAKAEARASHDSTGLLEGDFPTKVVLCVVTAMCTQYIGITSVKSLFYTYNTVIRKSGVERAPGLELGVGHHRKESLASNLPAVLGFRVDSFLAGDQPCLPVDDVVVFHSYNMSRYLSGSSSTMRRGRIPALPPRVGETNEEWNG